MNNKKTMRKKRHPYAFLAMFTLAAAGVINVTNKAKDFIVDKAQAVANMFRKKA